MFQKLIIKNPVVDLVDLRSFKILHRWNIDLNNLRELTPVRKNFWIRHPLLLDDGSLIFKHHGPLVKINKKSDIEWIKDDVVYHHSLNFNNSGDIWVCVHYSPPRVSKIFLEDEDATFIDDGIRKISTSGEVLFDKSVTEIFLENGMGSYIFGRENIPKDPLHLNDIEEVRYNGKYWEKGDLFLSLRNLSMIVQYRPSTNEVIWKGTGPFYFQHDINVLDNNRISFFNNDERNFSSGLKIKNEYNKVTIYDFKANEYSNYLEDAFRENKISTITNGLSTILDNGDVFVEETKRGKLHYISSEGKLIWSNVNLDSAGFVHILSWSRILYEENDIKKVQKFLTKIK
ncbi:arylsulfotransferase family protein [Candidatus Marinimicrobia bacterium]|nr:arylsulfotransferase family protein [Candidatus Neomarinimicrobiota bacterium]